MTLEREATDDVTATHASTRRVIVFWGLLLGLLLSTLDGSIVNAALPSIVHDFGGLERFVWVITGYGMALAVTTLLAGKLGDLFGHKVVFVTGVVVFLAGSCLCGLAGTMDALIASRILQGVGGGGLVVSTFSLIAQLFTPQERPRYQSYTTTVFALASMLGPLVGGLVTDTWGWRWAFLVNLPIGAATLAVVVPLLPHVRPTATATIDYLGSLLISLVTVGISALIFWVGRRDRPAVAIIAAVAVAVVVAGAAWVAVERKAVQPVVPLNLLTHGLITTANLVNFLAGFAILASVAFLPLFLQAASGASASQSGLLLVPMMLGVVATSTWAGRRISAKGSYAWYPAVSMAVSGAAVFLLSCMTADTSWPVVVLFSTLLGIGSGLSMQVFVLVVQNAAPRAQLGAATATVTFARLMGAAVGTSVLGIVFDHRLRGRLAERFVGSGIDVGTVREVTAQSLERLPAQTRRLFTLAYADSLSSVFLAAVPALVLALLLAVRLGRAITRPEPTSQG